MPTVSIIVPVYNAQAYLHKCINSLLSQSYTDFEILLINDGSKDNSGNICDEFAKKDKRIRVIHKENGGVSSARNRGLDESQGKYIMFCDSDDFICHDFCKPLTELAQDDEDCLVIAGITLLNDSGKDEKLLCPAYSEGDSVTLTNTDFCDLYVNLNLKKPFQLMHMPYNKLFSRKVIESNQLRFNTEIHYNEDFIFNLNYLDKVSRVKIFNDSIYNYYTDVPGSLCKRYFKDIITMFTAKEDALKSVIIDKASDKTSAEKVWYTLVFNDTNRAINNTFSQSNTESEKDKIKYCTKLIRNKRFRLSLKYADKSGYNKLYVFALKIGSYKLIHLLKKLF